MTMSRPLRSLRRTPTFTITAILTLVLGIAAIGSMFTIVYGVLIAPLHYGEPDRLVSLGLQSADLRPTSQPPAVYFTYRQFATQLAEVGFYRTGNTNIRNGGDADLPQRVTATWLTASMLPLLRVAPLLGRSFTAAEEQPGGPSAVILSEAEWRSRYGAANDVLGKTLMVNDVPREIVGVMPACFAFPDADTRVWLSARLRNDATVGEFLYSGVGRLRAGVSATQAQRELEALLPEMATMYPRLESGGSTATWLAESGLTPRVTTLQDTFTAGIAGTLWMLAAAAALVLLVAWANVTNLMLIRADTRQNELAVRATLGAGRLRIAAHFLGESLCLSAIAGALALLVIHIAVRALVAFGPNNLPRLSELNVGLTTVGFVTMISLISAFLGAAVPSLRWRRANLCNQLHDGARGGSAGKSRQHLRMSIAALQIALALVVSVGSALLLRTAQRLSDVDPGFDGEDVTTLWTLLPFAGHDDAATVAFHARLSEQVRALPSVTAAGLTMHLPLTPGGLRQQAFRIEGDSRTLALPVNVVDEGYFSALGIAVLAGRTFRRDGGERNADIIINQSAAAILFDEADGTAAVGKQLTLAPSGLTCTIVGVVADVREQDLATAPAAMIYLPHALAIGTDVDARTPRMMALVVKAKGSSDALIPAVRRIVRDLDPTVPIFNIATMDDIVRASTARLSLTLMLITTAAVIALLLGAIGLYGVMAAMVTLRTREFGIRIALGANPTQVARLVVTRGLALTAAGITVGFVLYAIAAPFLRAFLYDMTPADPLTLVAVTLVLVSAAALASWHPARRAARIDPAEALRAE